MIESMKEKTRRLERIIKGKNAGKTDTFVFSEVRKMIELALAEEREACKAVCERVEESNDFVGKKLFVEGISAGASLCIMAIENRSCVPAAPKDEVSE